MYSNYTELFSLLLVVAYVYKKVRDKITLWVLGYVLFLVCCIYIFRLIYPEVLFFSPTVEYIGFLLTVGIPFLILIILIGVEVERRRKRSVNKEPERGVSEIFRLTKDNIIFWTLIAVINLIAYLLERNIK